MRIGVDCDGVVADYTGAFANLVHEYSGKEVDAATALFEGDVNNYDAVQKVLNHIYGRDGKAFDWWLNIPLCCSDADIEALHILDLKHDLFFLTARPVYLHKVTFQWIEKMVGVTHPRLIVGARNKGSICSGLNIAHFLDDRYLQSLEVLDNKLTVPYILAQPWNMEYNHPLILRVNTIKEFVDRVNE